jgi:hypothetical protein
MDQPNQPVSEKQRFPTWKQALVMFLGGGALAISACFGCLFATLGAGNRTNSALEGVGIFLGIVAFIGLIASLVGVVLVLMRILRAMFGKRDAATGDGSNGGSGGGERVWHADKDGYDDSHSGGGGGGDDGD